MFDERIRREGPILDTAGAPSRQAPGEAEAPPPAPRPLRPAQRRKGRTGPRTDPSRRPRPDPRPSPSRTWPSPLRRAPALGWASVSSASS